MEEFAHNLAFFVAIDDYTNGVRKLSTPVADATAIANVLQGQHQFTTKILKNGAATLADIRTLLEDLKQSVQADDRVVFYFAGHGTAIDSKTGPVGYLLPQDAKADSSSSYLPMQDLANALAALPCRHMLVILDCCFAGAFRWASTRDLALAPERVHQQRYRWFVDYPAWQALASAAHDQRALDVADERPLGKRDERQAHSPFAAALIEGLSGTADRPPKGEAQGDGVITVTELYLHLMDALLPVDDWSFRQTPIFWPLENHRKGEFVFLAPGVELDLPPAPPLDETSNPWRGLKPYDSSDSNLFFGRKRASEQLLAQVLRDPLVVVTGPSGTGKSSLVRAGLLPRLPRSILPIVVKPGPQPLASLAAALRAVSASTPDAAEFEKNSGALAGWVKQQQLAGREMLLVVDQAEELVTQARGSQAMKRFLELLEIALDQTSSGPRQHIALNEAEATTMLSSLGYADVSGLHLETDGAWHATATADGERVQAVLNIAKRPLRVVFTIRSEFESQFAELPLKDHWRSSRYFIPPMTQDELRRVIEGPATAKVMRFESTDLVDTLVNEVVQMPGALPLLSFALSEMYLSYLKSPMHDRTLTGKHYGALQGGVAGSLRVRATRLIDSFNEDHQLTARRALERLVSIESGEFARRRVPRSELDAADETERKRIEHVLGKLDEALLIITDEVEHERHVELAHDTLILGWDLLVGWLKDDLNRIVALRRLTPDAEQWAATRDAGFLWDDAARVGLIRELKRSKSPGLNATEAEFAAASLRRSKRNTIAWWSIAAVLLLLTIGAAAFAWIADENASRADSQSARNRSLLLASQSREVLGTNDQRSLLLAVEAAQSTSEGEVTSAARTALHNALQRVTGFAVNGHRYEVSVAAFSADERFLASGSLDPSTAQLNEVRVWDISAPEQPKLTHIARSRERLVHVSFDRVAAHLVTVQTHRMIGSDESTTEALVWPLVAGQQYPVSRPLLTDQFEPDLVAESPGHEYLAVANATGTILLVGLDDLSETRVEKRLQIPANDRIARLAFSPDNGVLLACTRSSRVWTWDLRSDAEAPVSVIAAGHHRVEEPSDALAVDICGMNTDRTVTLTASSDWLFISTQADFDLKLWRIGGLAPTGEKVVLSHRGASNSSAIQAAGFANPGDRVYSLSLDGWFRSWKLDVKGDGIEAIASAEYKVGKFVSDVSVSDDSCLLAFSLGIELRLIPVCGLAGSSTVTPLAFTGLDSGPSVVRFSPRNRFLFAGSNDGKGRLWDLSATEAGEGAKPSPYKKSLATSLSADGLTAAILLDQQVEFWDLHDPRSPSLRRRWQLTPSQVESMQRCFSCMVITSSKFSWAAIQGTQDNESTIVELKEDGRVFEVPSRTWRWTSELEFSDDERWLFVEEGNKEVIYDLAGDEWHSPRRVVAGLPDGSYYRDIVLSRQFVLYRKFLDRDDPVGRSETVGFVWPLGYSGNLRRALEIDGFATEIGDVQFSHDGRWMALADQRPLLDSKPNQEHVVRLYWLDALGSPIDLTGHEFAPNVRSSKDGRWLLTASFDDLLQGARTLARLWRIDSRDTPPKMFVLPNIRTYLHSAQFSPDGRYLVTISGGGPTAQLWRLDGGEPMLVSRLTVPRQTHYWGWGIDFDEKSTVLVVVNPDNPTPYLWRLDAAKVPEGGIPIGNIDGKIGKTLFSADNSKMFIQNGGDGNSRITAVDLQTFPGENSLYHIGEWPSVLQDFSYREGPGVVLVSFGNELRIELVEPAAMIADAKLTLGRNMSLDEWNQTEIGEVYRPTFSDFVVDAVSLEALIDTAGRLVVGDPDAAEALADNIVSWTRQLDEANTCNGIGWAFALRKDGRRALDAVSCALSHLPDDPSYRDTRGVAYALVGETEKAISDLEFFVAAETAEDPDSAAAETRRRWIADLKAGKDPFAQGIQ